MNRTKNKTNSSTMYSILIPPKREIRMGGTRWYNVTKIGIEITRLNKVINKAEVGSMKVCNHFHLLLDSL